MTTLRKAKAGAQTPVSAHPLFPVIVALWFAALLGIGTMVLPQALFDALGTAAGLNAAGFSLRLGLGLAAGASGGVLGLLLARKVASGQAVSRPPKRTRSQGDGPAKRPISAMEELGSDGLDEPIAPAWPGSEPVAGRRRALAVTDESGPSEYLASVPLPGGSDVLDLMGADNYPEEEVLELDHFDKPATDHLSDHSTDPMSHTAFAQDHSPTREPAPFAAQAPTETGSAPFGRPVISEPFPAYADDYDAAPAPAPFNPANPPRPFAPPPSNHAPFSAPQPAPAAQAAINIDAEPQGSGPFAAPQPAPAPLPFAMPQAAESDMPVPFSAPSPFAASPALDPVTGPAPVSAAAVAPAPEPAAARRELAGLGMVDLVERFAAALSAARPAAPAQVAGSIASPIALGIGALDSAPPFGPSSSGQPPFGALQAAAEPAAPAELPQVAEAPFTAPFAAPGQAASIPAALRPFGFDEHDEHDETDNLDHAFSLPFASAPKPFAAPALPNTPAAPFAAPFAMPQPAGVDSTPAADDNSDDDGTEDQFGSLLAMKSGFGIGREHVRIDDEEQPRDGIEPVVVFPGTAQPGRAMPASDGPSRAPAGAPPAPAPFARPAFSPPASQPVDRAATETALREALAKLQQMSGAA
ncbi:MAG: hypothetical protein ACK4GD_06925 [Sphingomonadaceae bacterium]